MLFYPAGDHPAFADFQWADSIPKLLQARLIDSFENYDLAHAPLRAPDIAQPDFQLLVDVRRFRINTDPDPAAEIGMSARIVDKSGKVVASRLFEQSRKLVKIEPAEVVDAFNAAFAQIGAEIVAWTVQAQPEQQ
jgi:phospholipid/cholesterol/gamma-HCH transport system substrate-binding protein